MAYVTNLTIQGKSFNQLVKMLDAGEVSISRLKSYFTQARKLAKDRQRRLEKSEFSEIVPKEVFLKLRDLTTTSALVHEIADVNRFLNKKGSTITGQKKQRSQMIQKLSEHGFNIDESRYIEFRVFMEWFKSTKYAATFDSDSPQVQEAFEEGSTENDWTAIFDEFISERERQSDKRERR